MTCYAFFTKGAEVTEMSVMAKTDGGEEIAGIVRGYRRKKGLSQADLASRAGVSIATVSRLERMEHTDKNPTRIHAKVIHKLAFTMGADDGAALLDAAGFSSEGFRFVDDKGPATPAEMEAIVAGLTDEELEELRHYAEYLRGRHG